jgi:hypothetical protein
MHFAPQLLPPRVRQPLQVAGRRLVLLAGVACIAACTALPLLQSEVRLSANDLARQIEKRFPVERSVAGLVDITFSRPQMSLNAGEGRIAVAFEMTVRVPLSTRLLNGKVAISGRPEYEPASRSLFLREGKVERLTIDSMPEALSGALARLASQLAKNQLEEKPLYAFQPDELSRHGASLEPESIEVRDDALIVKLKKS